MNTGFDNVSLWQVRLDHGWVDLSQEVSKDLDGAGIATITPYVYGRFTYSIQKTTNDTGIQTNDHTQKQRNVRRILQKFVFERVWKIYKRQSKKWVHVPRGWDQVLEQVQIDTTETCMLGHITYEITRRGEDKALAKNENIGGTRTLYFKCFHCVVVWQWRENDGTWHDYNSSVGDQIEKLSPRKKKLKHQHGQHVYLISRFSHDEGSQYNMKTKFSRDIRRIKRVLPGQEHEDDEDFLFTNNDEEKEEVLVWQWEDDGSVGGRAMLFGGLFGVPAVVPGPAEWKFYDSATSKFLNRLDVLDWNVWKQLDIPDTEEQNRYEVKRTSKTTGVQRNMISNKERNIRCIPRPPDCFIFDPFDYSSSSLMHIPRSDSPFSRIIIDNEFCQIALNSFIRETSTLSMTIKTNMNHHIRSLLLEYTLGMHLTRSQFDEKSLTNHSCRPFLKLIRFQELPNKTLLLSLPYLDRLDDGLKCGIIGALTHHKFDDMDIRLIRRIKCTSCFDFSEFGDNFGMHGMQFLGNWLYYIQFCSPASAQIIIQSLNLSKNSLTADCMMYLHELVTKFHVFGKIRHFDLSGNELEDDGVRCFLEICMCAPQNCGDFANCNPYIRSLDVTNNGMTDVGLRYLCDFIVRNPFIERVDFGEYDDDGSGVVDVNRQITAVGLREMNELLVKLRKRYIRVYHHAKVAIDQNAIFEGHGPDDKFIFETEQDDNADDRDDRRSPRRPGLRRQSSGGYAAAMRR